MKRYLVFGVAAIGLSALVIGAVFLPHAADEQDSIERTSEQSVDSSVETEEILAQPDEQVEQFDTASIQSAVDGWLISLPDDIAASVYITDTSGMTIVETDIARPYFAASLYKLYVAYFGYQQIDQGLADPQQLYVGDRSRIECLDAMIRESDSPCAERMWSDLGKQETTDQLVSIGIVNTDMTNITTTAEDAGLLLGKVLRGEGLSSDSKRRYLDSLLEQPELYRRGLPSGFSSSVSVYNKVGWNLDKEWHDSALVQLADGRQLIVSVLSDGVGFSGVADLASRIESAL